jgi:hypothetical protein
VDRGEDKCREVSYRETNGELDMRKDEVPARVDFAGGW